MDHFSKLYYWFMALGNDYNAALALSTIKDNFAAKNFPLSDDDLNTIMGPRSALKMFAATI